MQLALSLMLTISTAFYACKKEKYSTPTLGNQTIYCDKALETLITQLEKLFERQYKYAQINLEFLDEHDLFNRLLTDSNAVIIAGRAVNQEESDILKKQGVHPRHWPFGTSAIAIIANQAFRDTNILYEEFLSYLTNPAFKKCTIVIENAKSGIARMLSELTNIKTLGENVYALKDRESVFEYVLRNDNALGLIDWSAISDSDDRKSSKRLSQVILVGLSRPKDSTQLGFLQPYQYNLQDKKYPLCRDLYIISRSGRDDLGLGFAAFITGEIGQKVVLKAGLMPRYQSERTIELIDRGNLKVIQ